jgi:DNA-binding MarR family transcriptional regulator
MTLTDLYCRMRSTWQSQMPKLLADENPQILTQLLRLAEVKEGVSHSDIERDLAILESRLSKLVAKLLEEGWLRVVPKPKGDRRKRFVQTTPKAASAMRLVEVELASALEVKSPVRSRRKETPVTPGLMDLLSRAEHLANEGDPADEGEELAPEL